MPQTRQVVVCPYMVHKLPLTRLERLLQDMRNAAGGMTTSPTEALFAARAPKAVARGTSLDDAAFTPSAMKRSRTLRTYGASAKRSKTSVHEISAKDATGAIPGGGVDQVPHDSWNLSPLLRADFAQHNPRSMFSEPSSTAPFNTMTQENMLREALRDNMVGIDRAVATEPTQRTDSSIPWSASLNTQPQATALGAVSETEPGDLNHHPSPVWEEAEPPSKMAANSTLSRPSPRKAAAEIMPSRRSARKPLPTGPRESPHHVAASSVHVLSEIEISVGPEVEMERPTNKVNKAAAPTRPRRSKTTAQKAPKPSEDDLGKGLLGDQYVPRPSRRRSNQISEAAYAENVRQILLPKPKRRRTIQDTPDTTDESLRSFVNVGISSNYPRQSVTAPAGNASEAADVSTVEADRGKENVTHSHDCVEVRAFSDDVDVKHSVPTRKTAVEVAIPFAQVAPRVGRRGGPRSSISERDNSVDRPKEPTHFPTGGKMKISRRHTTMGPASPGKSQKQILDSDDSSSEVSPIKEAAQSAGISFHESTPLGDVRTLIEGNSVPTEKKSGRGGPRSNRAVDVHENTTEKHFPAQEPGLQTQSKWTVAEDFPENVPAPSCKDKSESLTVEVVRSDRPPGTSVLPSTPTEPSAASLKTSSQVSSKQSPLQHSPINQGKVPYRVGLSKRARIAPLLRVRRK